MHHLRRNNGIIVVGVDMNLQIRIKPFALVGLTRKLGMRTRGLSLALTSRSLYGFVAVGKGQKEPKEQAKAGKRFHGGRNDATVVVLSVKER